MPLRGKVNDDDLFASAQCVISAHLARTDLDLAMVATLLDVSRWRLSRAFSSCEADFRSSVRRARMLQAGRRLREREAASIKEVAIDVGYRHHSDFTRHFRAHWGMTPTAFRERTAGAAR